jgi:hypothetical protein
MRNKILALSIFAVSTVFSSFACNDMPEKVYNELVSTVTNSEGFRKVAEFRSGTIDYCLTMDQIKKVYAIVAKDSPEFTNQFISIALSKVKSEDDRNELMAMYKK